MRTRKKIVPDKKMIIPGGGIYYLRGGKMKKILAISVVCLLLAGIPTAMALINQNVEYQEYANEKPLYNVGHPKIKASFRGAWGHDNQTQGYLKGMIGIRGRTGLFKGVWNTTDNSTIGNITGIFRGRHFVGKVTSDNVTIRIVGRFRINVHTHTIKARWKVENQTGWFIGRYRPVKSAFRGIWGFGGDNQTWGCLKGICGPRGRIGFFKGVWNTTDDNITGHIIGIGRGGRFIGMISAGGRHTPIRGRYVINEEGHFGMTWKVHNQTGWSRGKIL